MCVLRIEPRSSGGAVRCLQQLSPPTPKDFIVNYMYICVCVWLCAHVNRAHGGHKKVLDPWNYSHRQLWTAEMDAELRAHPFNLWTVFPVTACFVVVIVCLFVFCLIFRDRVSLCRFGASSGTPSVDQADLEITEIHLPLPPKVGLKECTITVWQSLHV